MDLLYYKTLLALLHAPFLTAFNALPDVPDPPASLLVAYVTITPQGNKGPTQAANYRPISLLNMDLKIYTKISTMRIITLLPSWVSLDQVGHVLGQNNTIKSN